MFGGSLGKHHVTSMELDSDQESTDGEGEMSWVAPCDRRALLSPELLLFRWNTCLVPTIIYRASFVSELLQRTTYL